MEKYDLIIIGGGSAGFAAAMKANDLKIKTLMVNNDTIGLGGTCVNVGCVPTKYLLNIGDLINESREQRFEGIKSSISVNFHEVIEGKNNLIKQLQFDKYENVLKKLPNVDLVEGNAKFISNSEIQVDNQTVFQAKNFIIATGSSSLIPPIKGIEQVDYITNIEALQLKKLPKSMIVIGGGALGVEFAQLFSRYGTKVNLFEMLDRIVPNEEPEISKYLEDYFQEEGIEIYTNAKIIEIENDSSEKIIKLLIKNEESSFKAEHILIAAGRKPNTHNLGLEKVDINLGKKGEIIVDEFMNAGENIWAAGDVIGEPMLETVAAREGMIAANNALSNEQIKMDYRIVPHAIFTNPQVGSVGLTDLQANLLGFDCRCNTIPIGFVAKSKILKDDRGLLKIVINRKTEEILGIHILSANAANLIHESVVIIKNHMTLDDVINTIHVFPTLSEAIKLTAQSFKRDISVISCCIE
ncbi:MAG: mercury(II) reductase [Candidatus Thorarchaeota archaeon]